MAFIFASAAFLHRLDNTEHFHIHHKENSLKMNTMLRISIVLSILYTNLHGINAYSIGDVDPRALRGVWRLTSLVSFMYVYTHHNILVMSYSYQYVFVIYYIRTTKDCHSNVVEGLAQHSSLHLNQHPQIPKPFGSCVVSSL